MAIIGKELELEKLILKKVNNLLEKTKEELKKQAEPPKTPEELEKDKQASTYCSTLGDGLCVPEENEQIVKQNLHQEIDK